MIFRYMSGTVYQGAWPDPISGEVTRYYGTKRMQMLPPKQSPKIYSEIALRIQKNRLWWMKLHIGINFLFLKIGVFKVENKSDYILRMLIENYFKYDGGFLTMGGISLFQEDRGLSERLLIYAEELGLNFADE